MITIIKVLGYSDEAGLGNPISDQLTEEDFYKAKTAHQYPKGTKHLKMFRCEEIDCAVFLGTSVGDAFEAAQKQSAVAAAAASKKSAETKKVAAELESAQARVQETSKARNELMGKIHELETHLRNHDLTPEKLKTADGIFNLRDKNHDSKVKKIQDQLAELKPQLDKAKSEYESAAESLAELTKPADPKKPAAQKRQLVDA
jgi:hypothetical protein